MPLISIIIPTLNRPHLLTRAIKSALAQSITDFEIIVIVDGRDPDSISTLGKIIDQRIRVMENATSVGSAHARNAAVEVACGSWIAFLDDDDEWLPRKLELQLAAAESFDQNIIVSCLTTIVTPIANYVWPRCIYDNKLPIDEYMFDRRSFFRGDTFLQTSSFFMRRELFDTIRFNKTHDDMDFILRAVNIRRVRVVTVTEPLVIVYMEEQRPSLSSNFRWRESLEWLEEIRPSISRRAYSGFCLTILGSAAAKSADYSTFFTLLLRAFRFGSPRPVHVILYFVFWLFPTGWRQRMRKIWSGAPDKTSTQNRE